MIVPVSQSVSQAARISQLLGKLCLTIRARVWSGASLLKLRDRQVTEGWVSSGEVTLLHCVFRLIIQIGLENPTCSVT